MRNLDELVEVVREYNNLGLFTHCGVTAGRLETPDEFIRIEICPNSQTIFDLSSLTKAFVTTPLVFLECKNEEKSLNATMKDLFVANWLPEELANLSVESLLKHQSGLPAWRNFYVNCEGESKKPQDRIQRVVDHLQLDKGGADEYSDIGMILLGRLLEEKHQKSLAVQFQEFRSRIKFSSPNLGYAKEFADKSRFIGTGFCNVRQRNLCGEVHDENCWALGGITGHSGLFGTAPACAAYLSALSRTDLGNQILSFNEELVSPGNPSLLGWRQGNDYSSEIFANGLAMGHLGFTGTAFWVEPKTHRFAVVLTNRIVSGRLDPRIKEFRRASFKILSDIIP